MQSSGRCLEQPSNASGGLVSGAEPSNAKQGAGVCGRQVMQSRGLVSGADKQCKPRPIPRQYLHPKGLLNPKALIAR